VRFDRLFTLAVVQPWRRTFRLLKNKPYVPVLMYHSITDASEPGVAPYYQLNTTPSAFRFQMQYLADNGFKTMPLGSLVTALNSGTGVLPRSTVVLTFDDGLRNFYTDAFPILQEFGSTATMFLSTAFVGETPCPFRPSGASMKPVVKSSSESGTDCLTWSEIRELSSQGISFGSHTVTHPKLVDLNWTQIQSELRDSKAEIENRLQLGCDLFCYPYAFPQADDAFSARFREMLQELGYACCATTQIGCAKPGDDPLTLKRLPVNSQDDDDLFEAKLSGAYDWLANAQSVVKRVKSLTR
jgi:peptidoglycan/xylan/chitin deacetylase (PgdA/CDA1 family)